VSYPQNGDRIVTIDSVKSLHPVCTEPLAGLTKLLRRLALLQVAPSSEKDHSFSSTRPLRTQPAADGHGERQRRLSDALAKLTSSPFVFTLMPPSPHNHAPAVSTAPSLTLIVYSSVFDVVGRQRLRSATQKLMVVPRHRLSTV